MSHLTLDDSIFTTTLTLMHSETIWLESEQIDRTRAAIDPLASEVHQWQMYLNTLAAIGLERWLQRHGANRSIDRTQCINEVGAIYNFQVNGFKLTLLVKEHVLDEVVEIPTAAIELPAHFYIPIEVSEEREEVIIRGLLRYDRLQEYLNRVNRQCVRDGYYHIPLAVFDPEPNRLLFYCDLLAPTSIPLPATATERSTQLAATLTAVLQTTRIELGQWLQGVFTPGWQAIDELMGSAADLALSPRIQGKGAKCGKLIDLGVELPGQSAVLLLNITEEAEEKLAVVVQLHPAGTVRYLPPDLVLTLLSKSGEKLQEVHSRSQDNYIQLKSFKGRSGTNFSIAIGLGNFTLCENFEL
jgi:hypothetical protein